MATQVVVMTTHGATSDAKVVKTTIPCFHIQKRVYVIIAKFSSLIEPGYKASFAFQWRGYHGQSGVIVISNRALKTKKKRRPQSQRPQMPPVAPQSVAMTTNGAPGDDKAVQPAIPCFQFEKNTDEYNDEYRRHWGRWVKWRCTFILGKCQAVIG